MDPFSDFDSPFHGMPGRGHRRGGSRMGGFGFGFGPGFPFGRGFGGPGGSGRWPGAPRARRGDVRAAILALLAEEARNGYQIMQELEKRSGGAWRPSPGAVYPALQQLQDEGLVKEEAGAGSRVFSLTAEGRAYVKDHPDEVAAPWDAVTGSAGEEFFEFLGVLRDLGATVMQISGGAQPRQQAAARKILTGALRELRKVLAEYDDE